MRAATLYLVQDVLPMHNAKLHLGPLGLQVLLQLLVPLLERVGLGQQVDAFVTERVEEEDLLPARVG